MPSKAALEATIANEKKKIIDENRMKKISKLVEKLIKNEFSTSSRFTTAKVENITTFDRKEIVFGRVLGRGGFGIVNDIQSIKLLGDFKCSDEHKKNRRIMQENTTRSIYVVKNIQQRCRYDVKQCYQALLDLVVETYILAAISHQNIIKLCAIRDGDIFSPRYFIVLERLDETLERRIYNDWKKKKESIFFRGKYKKIFQQQLLCCLELSTAIEYLHSNNVIYRDVKPENVGFDSKGCTKLFDFGLAKHLPSDKKLEDGTYKLTGEAGSMRYMAPEVKNCENYNFSVDVYSLGIVFWEILALELPFKDYGTVMYTDLVVKKGYRPKCCDSWSETWVKLLKSCWHKNSKNRPPPSVVRETLREQYELKKS